MISLIANQIGQAQDTQIALGLDVGAAPDYKGSEDYEAVPIPYVNVKWSNHMSINWLGKQWKKMNPEQQSEFVKLFKELLQGVYADRLLAYSDQKIIYEKEIMLK